MAMEEIEAVLEEGKTVDAALISIGNPHKESTLREIGYLKEMDLDNLRKVGVVGDIAFRFFDKFGEPTNHPINNKVIGISLEQLRAVQTVIAVVEGSHKVESVLGALKGNYLDVLIIDETTAALLLDKR
ncbi:hypothetical protein GCM10020331_013410 [Ectobacillus funiculus]